MKAEKSIVVLSAAVVVCVAAAAAAATACSELSRAVDSLRMERRPLALTRAGDQAEGEETL